MASEAVGPRLEEAPALTNGVHAATDAVATLNDHDTLKATLMKAVGRREPGEAPADDDRVEFLSAHP